MPRGAFPARRRSLQICLGRDRPVQCRAELRARMNEADPVRLCLQGRIAPEVAIARLLLAGESPDAIARRVGDARTSGKNWAALARLLAARGEAFGSLLR